MKSKLTLALAALAVMFSSCDGERNAESAKRPDGLIQISIASESDATKASDTNNYGNEATINKVEVLVFGSDGTLNGYANLGSSLTGTVECKSGTGNTVCVVANGPSSLSQVTSLTEYNSIALDLTAVNVPTSGFVMAGSQTGVSVIKDSTTPISINISRLVSRVQLVSLTNGLPSSYGAVTIRNVMLTNVVGNQNLNGNAAINSWYNPMGRKNESTLVSSHIVDGYSYVSTAAALTFKQISGVSLTSGSSSTTKYRFYGFPNATSGDTEGFSSTMSARYTRLVITAEIMGYNYYYPVNIPTPVRNKTYDVSVTLLHLGSVDPDVLVATGTVSVTVTVDGWSSGSPIVENL